MKTLFIETQRKYGLDKNKIEEISIKLPKNITIAYSIQYRDFAKEIKAILEKEHKITHFVQVLGCSKPKFQKTQAILLISSGKFHAINLALITNLPIYIVEANKIEKISEKDIDEIKNRQKASYVKFLNSKTVGILVSTKPGQENMKKALELKRKLDKKGKRSYLFMANNINTNEFENFNIDSWVNTACPRLDMDFKVINIDKIN